MSEIRTAELASFLRGRREAITPGEVGLPTAGRRRTPGLRREEVAQLATVGTTWYTWLEQGRAANPSVQVLRSIARALNLNPEEERHLLKLGGHARSLATPSQCEEVSVERRRVLDALLPNPASIMNSLWLVLACNDTFRFMINDLERYAPEERSCLWLDFTDPEWGKAYVDGDEEQAAIVARMRSHFADAPDDDVWQDLIHRLSERSARFRELWKRGTVGRIDGWTKRVMNPYVGLLALEVQVFSLPYRPDLRMVTYLPGDDRTAGRLVRLHAMVDELKAGTRLAS
ncbi:MAG: helix-turn-helix transcriptional regulator [Propionibacteriales bacterium]|nr:helix-turn-helix transcriptional regulator [Propionibacteriales bacterium]